MTVTNPRRRDSAPTRSRAAARSDRPLPRESGGIVMACRIARTWGRPGRGGNVFKSGPATSTAPEPVLVAGGEEPDGGRGAEGQRRLLRPHRREAHRCRHVDDQPALQVAVGDLVAHVQLAGAGGDVPVDPAHVVADLIQPALARVAAVAGRDALVLAVEETVELARHRQLQRPQHLRERVRRGTCRPGDIAGFGRVGHSALSSRTPTAPRGWRAPSVPACAATRGLRARCSAPDAGSARR